MFTTALLALDLSPAEGPILGCMPALRRWGVARLVVVHVIRVGYAQGPTYREDETTAARLEADVAPLRAAGLDVEVMVRTAGVPADDILAAAAEVGADLVIVGSRSHNLLHRVFLGSVAREVIRKSTLPVLLEWLEPTPEATKERCQAVCTDPLARVLLATDLSRHAAGAEQAAVSLAAAGARIDMLTVVSARAGEDTPALPLMVHAALAALQGRMQAPGGPGEIRVEVGEAAPTIEHLATALDSSLVIVGRHGRGRVRDVLIGSTAAQLCETAGRPVLVVPAADGG